MWLDAFLLILGLALIIKGGDLFVGASVQIAEWLKVPRLVIGSTLVSLATTSPELVVSIMAGLKGEPGLAVGNAVGSCICNLGLILGVTAVIRPVEVHPGSLRAPLIALFAASLVLLIMTLDLVVNREQGLVLIVLGLSYFLFDLIKHLQPQYRGQIVEAQVIQESVTEAALPVQSRQALVLEFLGGAVLVVLGSRWLVDGAVSLAGTAGIPPLIIGLTVVALGTSLPELVTAVTSSRRQVSDLAVGNVLGANIANLSLIVGAAAVITPVTLTRATQLFNFPAMLLLNLMLLCFLFSGRRLSRAEGWCLIAYYVAYLAALITLTAAKKI